MDRVGKENFNLNISCVVRVLIWVSFAIHFSCFLSNVLYVVRLSLLAVSPLLDDFVLNDKDITS
jgi:hypothetical protein